MGTGTGIGRVRGLGSAHAGVHHWAHQRLTAFGLSDHYRQIFSLTRIDEAISLQDDEESALAAARGAVGTR